MPHIVKISPYGLRNCAKIVEQLQSHPVGGDAVTFDLRRLTFVTPHLLALFAAHVRRHISGELGVVTPMQVLLPKVPAVANYLKGMNLVGALTRGERVLLDGMEAQYLPLCPLKTSDDTEAAARRLKQIVIAKLTTETSLPAENVASALAITLAELMENFRKHAESTGHAFVCAQFYGQHEYQDSREHHRFRQGAIELAIADTGIGIEGSLLRHERHARAIRSGINACELATRFGVTSKEGEGHQGYGLWVTRRLAEKNLGTFFLVSGDRLFSVLRGRASMQQLSSPWPGTFVGIRLNLHRPVDINAVYAELPELELSLE